MKRTALAVALLLCLNAFAAPKNGKIPDQNKHFEAADAGALTSYQRVIEFSGLPWAVKTSDGGRVGPGPNFFSDSPKNVWVDRQGRLHLKITRVKGYWYCAEVVALASPGHGTYRWYLDSPVDDLDPNAVLGLFTWSTKSPYYNGEIDIEFSRWGSPNHPNAQFVVQPFNEPGHLYRFELPSSLEQTTHSFTWDQDSVYFESLLGHTVDNIPPELVLEQWLFDAPAFPYTDENPRINLWLYQGTPPSKRPQLEVIIRAFEFIPAP